jgi:hypothetical protein
MSSQDYDFAGILGDGSMRRLLVVVIASLLAHVAFAQDRPLSSLSLHCVPRSPLRDGFVSSDVSYSVAAGWSIAHALRDGRVVRREQQYDLRDGGHLAWEGSQKKNNNLVMTGQVVNTGGRLKYVERLHDRDKGGKKVSGLVETCVYATGDAAALAQDAQKPQRLAADASSAATSSPTTDASVHDNKPRSGFALPAALGVIGVIALILAVGALARRRKQKVLGIVDRAVAQHERALIRKRFQTLRHDDYGNIISDQWFKELAYFLEKVVEPIVIQSGDKEAALYRAMRQEILSDIESRLAVQANAAGTFTLGPNLTPTDYEQYCAQQLRAAGWVANTTKASGDQGTDIVAQKGGVRLVVQCKLFSQPVGNKAVQEVAAARAHEQADCAAVVSNAKYTYAAQQLAATNQVLLLHHGDLMHIDELIGT